MRTTTSLALIVPLLLGPLSEQVMAQKHRGAAGAIENLGGPQDHDDADEGSSGRSAVRVGSGTGGGYAESIDGFDFDVDAFDYDVDEYREAVKEMEAVRFADIEPLSGSASSTPTSRPPSSGMYFETGSFRKKSPSS